MTKEFNYEAEFLVAEAEVRRHRDEIDKIKEAIKRINERLEKITY